MNLAGELLNYSRAPGARLIKLPTVSLISQKPN